MYFFLNNLLGSFVLSTSVLTIFASCLNTSLFDIISLGFSFLRMTCQQFWWSCLDYKEKFAVAQTKADSLSSKNEVLKVKVTSLSNKVEKAQDRLKTLERDVNTEKAFSKLKDKQIDDDCSKFRKPVLKQWRSSRSLMSIQTSSAITMWMVLNFCTDI